MENKIEETTFADFDFPNFSRFLFKVTHFFIKEKETLHLDQSPSMKNMEMSTRWW